MQPKLLPVQLRKAPRTSKFLSQLKLALTWRESLEATNLSATKKSLQRKTRSYATRLSEI